MFDCLSGEPTQEWVCVCVCGHARTQAGMGVEAKRLFCFFCFHSWGQDGGWIERKREGRGSEEREWVSQLGEIKVGLTFSTPSTPAESPPVPSHLFFSPSFLLPSQRRISELGFPRLLSEEAIMMFWNTKAFHAQTSAWFGVKERAGLPAKLSASLWPSSLLFSSPLPSAALLPHKTWQCRQQLDPPPPLLCHSSICSPHLTSLGFGLWSQLSVLFSVWPQRKEGVYVSVFQAVCRGEMMCSQPCCRLQQLVELVETQILKKLTHLFKTSVRPDISVD